jgi:hypothetical protein
LGEWDNPGGFVPIPLFSFGLKIALGDVENIWQKVEIKL